MSEETQNVLIVGAGPASLYAAEALAKSGRHVVIINRDIKPGGLAEFGIYPNKYKMKRGLRKYFDRILKRDEVEYYGNIRVGEGADVTLEELQGLGFDAVVMAVGAQGTKWLGLPGEDADSVFHAKDLVYHYNGLPPFSEQEFRIGDDVCVVGLGNVCLDIVHWLVCEKKIATVTSVARRGPAERAYTEKEMKIVSGALDIEQVREEIDAIADALRDVGQDPEELFEEITAHKDEPLETESPTKFRMRFLRSPVRIDVDDEGRVRGLVCEKTRILPSDGGKPPLEYLDEFETLPCDTIIFAIGDSIEPGVGLPVEPGGQVFATVPEPWEEYPDRPRYMVYEPSKEEPMWGTFVVGWARRASDGLVGKARADAVKGCDEIIAYLEGEFEEKPEGSVDVDALRETLLGLLEERNVEVVDYDAVLSLVEIEEEIAEERDLPEFKFTTREAMLERLD